MSKKRLLALLLALTMCFSLAAPAYAEGENGYYTVTFNYGDRAEAVKVEKVQDPFVSGGYSGTVYEPENPTRADANGIRYEFVQWLYNGRPFFDKGSAIVTQDLTVDAQWTEYLAPGYEVLVTYPNGSFEHQLGSQPIQTLAAGASEYKVQMHEEVVASFGSGTNVAKIGDKEYTSLASAFNNLLTNTTIDLIADCTVTEPITIVTNTVTLNLNGNNISYAPDAVHTPYLFQLDNATMTVNGGNEANGSITVLEGNDNATGIFWLNDDGNTGSSLTLNNVNISGTFNNHMKDLSPRGGVISTMEKGGNQVITINGGNISVTESATSANSSYKTSFITLSESSKLTINGATLSFSTTRNGSRNFIHGVGQGGTVEITNSKITSTKPMLNTTGPAKVTLTNTSYGTPTGEGWISTAIPGAYGSTITVDGGTYTGQECVHVWSSGGTTTINSGTFVGDTILLHANAGNNNANQSDANIIVNGGTFSGGKIKVTGTANQKANITIHGGTFSNTSFEGANAYGTIDIDGGTFSIDPSAYVDLENYEVIKSGDAYVVVAKGTAVAETGGMKYATLNEAIVAAEDGATVNLLKSTSGAGVLVPDGTTKSLTIDFGGNTYTVNSGVGSTNTQFQMIHTSTGALTLKNGTITAAAGLENLHMVMQGHGSITIDGMTIDGTNVQDIVYAESYGATWGGTHKPHFNFDKSGNSTIKNSTIILANNDAGVISVDDNASVTIESGTFTMSGICTYQTDPRFEGTGTLSITGGTFNLDPSKVAGLTGTVSFVAEGRYAYPAGNQFVVGDEAAAKVQIGETKYPSMTAALAAVNDDETIKLLDNLTTYASINNSKTFTIDLNGNTLRGIDLYNAFVTVKDTADTKGKIGSVWVYCTNDSGYNAGDYNSFVLDTTATIDAQYGIVLKEASGNTGYGSKIDIYGTTTGNVFVMGNIHKGNSVINVYGTINSTLSNVGIALNGFATVNVYDGATIYSKKAATGTGIEVRAGTLNVSGGTITGNGAPTTLTPNGSGTTSTGAGIAVSTYDLSPINVTINGGTISGFSPLYLANTAEGSTKDFALSVTGGTFTCTEGGTHAVAMNEVQPETRAVKFISGGTFSGEPNKTFIATGYAAEKENDVWVIKAHTHTYGEPTWSWRRINGAWAAIASFTCTKNDDTQIVIAEISETEYQGELTTTATVTFNNEEYKDYQSEIMSYEVRMNGSYINSYEWGQLCTLTYYNSEGHEENQKWYFGSGDNRTLVADGRSTYTFAVTAETQVETASTNVNKPQAVISATLTTPNSGKAVYNVKWSLPTDAQVVSAYIHRGAKTASDFATRNVLENYGAHYDTRLNVRNGDFTLDITNLTSTKYQNVITVIVYTVNGESYELVAPVMNIKADGESTSNKAAS